MANRKVFKSSTPTAVWLVVMAELAAQVGVKLLELRLQRGIDRRAVIQDVVIEAAIHLGSDSATRDRAKCCDGN